nr:triple tyrosine motif-containing protein [uncultured Carboxylicivirga sp.]
MKKSIILAVLLCIYGHLWADDFNSGIPFITHYTEKDHHVSNKNHCIVQDQRGVLYFANDYGILEFDGNDWQIIQVPSNRSNVQSLALDANNRLYVGAQGDFGYIDYNKPYGLIFNSLLDKISAEFRNFGDIVNTFVLEDKVVFQCRDGLYIYRNNQIMVYALSGGILSAFKINNQIIVQGKEALFCFTGSGFEKINATSKLKNTWVRFILPRRDSWLIGTQQSGIYELKNNQLFPLDFTPSVNITKSQITTAQMNKQGDLIIGTRESGLFVIDKNNHLISHLTKTKGLKSNEISTLYFDQNDNLWVANKKGIDFVELASPFTRLLPDSDEPFEVYDATIFENNLYLATHKGLLYAPINKLNNVMSPQSPFIRVNGSDDINWSLNIIDQSLIVAHNGGFSQVKGGQIIQTISTYGGWKVIPTSSDHNHLIAGTYKGIVILVKNHKGLYQLEKQIDGFDESSRVMEVDNNGLIWIAHGYKGIYKLKLSNTYDTLEELHFYNHSKGLPTNFYNSVFKINQKIVFGTEYGIYRYDGAKDKMVLDASFTSNTWGWRIGRMLKQDASGNIWFVGNNSAGIMHNHPDGRTSIESIPFVKLSDFYIPGFESFTLLPNQNVLIGGKEGLVYFNMQKNKLLHQPFQVIIRRVSNLKNNQEIIYNDRFHYLCDTVLNTQHQLQPSSNSLQFDFATGFYENTNHLTYKYYLEGFDNDWSNWVSEPFKQYTNLPPGKYIFRVKARNTYGTESNEATFHFSILTPLYLTWPAITLYFSVIILILWLIIKIRTKRLTREKERLISEQQHLLKLEHSKLQEEQLRNDLQSKKEELSGLAMKVIYKNEKLSELKDKVTSIKEMASDKVARQLSRTLSFIDKELADDHWDDFEMRFDMAHNNFIKRLKEDFPNLTSKDLKMCAYLRMNLSTKEMAQLLNMTVRGVETARYRIRKRINLGSSSNLNEFILTY